MKLNPSKCPIGVALGKFLDFMASQKQIKLNTDKIQAILNMEPSKNVKDVQSLIGQVVDFNKFVSKTTNKCLPFFKVLRKAFEWMDKCQQAFEDLKVYLTVTLLLNPSQPREELYLYLAVSLHVVSLALIREEGKVQKLVYYTSNALRGVEGRYLPMEKLAFSLVIVARKLKPYFQTLNQHPYRSLAKEGHEQVGGHWMTNPMGSRTQ